MTLETGVYLAIDFGLRNIGLAVGQSITLTANPLKTIKADNGKPNWKEVESIIREWAPVAIIVGHPLNMDDSKSEITIAVEDFVEKLGKRASCPIHMADERLTTVEAKIRLEESLGHRRFTKDQLNAAAAQVILESWFAKKHE